ncbi:tagatose 1,6-diphosphate aldolase, partial [Pseudolactococcus reticulitermitis]
MKKLSPEKRLALAKLTTKDGIISALAIDQRGALKKMIANYKDEVTAKDIETFKVMVSEELTPFASAILLDPEYGLPAAHARAETSGLLLAYEKTGYDATTPGRLPDLLPTWSVKRLKAAGAEACKFLLYYDVAEEATINDRKHAFIERLGSECEAEGLPFFLELVSYDAQIADPTSADYAKVKPHKVNEMMRIFSEPQYQVDVLKVEVPVNMAYVEGFATSEVVYTQAEAAQHFAAQSAASELPFIFL